VLSERLSTYAKLMRLDRPIGTILLLWPTLWALWIAGRGHPDPAIVVIFMLGVLVMRSAGCVINDFADRKIDPHIERTQMRPMATGEVSTREALTLFTALSLFALGLVLQLNWETVLLAIPAVLLTISYPFVKRITHFPQVFLGVAFAWGIPMAFAAQTGTVPLEAWWLLSVNLFWVVGYDTLYAMVDREDDLKIGVRSTAIIFGRYDLAMVSLCHIVALGLLFWLGRHLDFGVYYYGGLVCAFGFALWQISRSRQRSPERCLQAFLNNSWLGAAVFVGLLLNYL